MRRAGLAVLVALGLSALAAGDERPAAAGGFTVTDDMKAALDHISADSLRGHLSFIASDLLEGRDTPSRGLDLAAEYIAAQFRRAGLEPAGDDGYFQTAPWKVRQVSDEGFSLQFRAGDQTIPVGAGRVSRPRGGGIDLKDAPIVKVTAAHAAELKPEQVEGKVVLTELLPARSLDREERQKFFEAQRSLVAALAKLKPAALLSIHRDPEGGTGLNFSTPSQPARPDGTGELTGLTVHEPKVVALFDTLPEGPSTVTVSAHLAAPADRTVKVRNVIGVLRGSDPALRDTYVFVTAHYDHLGVRQTGQPDNIYNGANDDGSGTVSVIELAQALATLRTHPKRSLVFMTFFGEEHGLLGSRYYAQHPIFPIDRTVADINLEQVGRTDSTEGPQRLSASMTGMDFSTVGSVFQAAGQREGIRVYKHPQNSDAYFSASDNRSFADLGVPAHSLCVAFAYPDYHGPADHWDKVDYANMARVDRMVGLGLLMLADDPEPPRWNDQNPRAERFARARQERAKDRP